MAYTIGVFTTLAILLFLIHHYQEEHRKFRLRMAAISGRMILEAKDWHTLVTEQIRERLDARRISWSSFLIVIISLFLGGGIFGYSITHSVSVGLVIGGILSFALPFRRLRKLESTFDYAHCVSLFEDVIPKGAAAMDLDGNLESAIREIANNGESPTGKRIMSRVNQWHRSSMATPGEYFLSVAVEEGHADWKALAAISAAVENRHPNMSKIWEQTGKLMRDEWEAREDFYDYFRGYRSSANIVFGIVLSVVIIVQTLVNIFGGHLSGNVTTLTFFGLVMLYLAARYVLDMSHIED
jgi:hypothetical protein